jgi:hypothetical protein
VTLESETKSIKVFNLRKSMLPPVFAVENMEFTLKTLLNSYKCTHFHAQRLKEASLGGQGGRYVMKILSSGHLLQPAVQIFLV